MQLGISRKRAVSLLAAAAIAGAAQHASAAVTANWSTAVSDSWGNQSRWSSNSVPTQGDTVNMIVTGGTYTVSYDTDTFTATTRAAGLTMSNSGGNTVTLAVSAANFRLGQMVVGANAIVDAQSGATLDVSGNMNFNNGAQLRLASGSSVRMSATTTGSLLIGNDSAGSLTMSGGTLISSGLESSNRGIFIGSAAFGTGAGTANVTGGEVQIAGRLTIGRYSGTSGSTRTISSVLNLSNATWANTGNVVIGQNANSVAAAGSISGSLLMSSGTFTVSGSSKVYVGAARAYGTLGLSGGSFGTSATRVSEILVGTTFTGDPATVGTGSLLVSGSAAVHTDQLTAINGANSVVGLTGGVLNVGGTSFAGANLSGGSTFLVGDGTTAATFNLAVGGSGDHSFAGGVSVASLAKLSGAGSVSGATSVAGELAAGDASTPGSVGTISLNDGLSLLASSTATFDFTSPSVTAGTYDQITSDGGDTVSFDGTLQLNFAGGVYADGTSVQIFNFASYTPSSFADVNYSGLGAGQEALFDSSTGVVTIAAVPEPTAAGLLAVGGLLAMRRRRAK